MVSQVIHAHGDEFKSPDVSGRDHDLSAIWAHHPDDREVRGAKEDLRTKKRKQSRKEFHEDHLAEYKGAGPDNRAGTIPSTRVVSVLT